MTIKFDLGQFVMTRGVNDLMADDIRFVLFVMRSVGRHANGDWGDVCAEDKRQNDLAITGETRILSAYETKDLPKIWIITEADRSSTTVLFPDEY